MRRATDPTILTGLQSIPRPDLKQAGSLRACGGTRGCFAVENGTPKIAKGNSRNRKPALMVVGMQSRAMPFTQTPFGAILVAVLAGLIVLGAQKLFFEPSIAPVPPATSDGVGSKPTPKNKLTETEVREICASTPYLRGGPHPDGSRYTCPAKNWNSLPSERDKPKLDSSLPGFRERD